MTDAAGMHSRVDAAFASIRPCHDVADVPIEVADSVIREIFSLGLGLAACAELVPTPTADRLMRLIADLDDVILDLRRAAL